MQNTDDGKRERGAASPGMDEAAGLSAVSQSERYKSAAQEISRASTGSDTVHTAI
jgi:hypothetical protein